MNKLGKLAIIGSGTLLLITSFTACSHKYRNPEYRADKMVEMVTNKLELNEQQQSKLQSLHEKLRSSRKVMREKSSSSKGDIETLLSQSTLDEKKILDMINEHTQFINQQAPDIVAAMSDFYNSLDTKQRIELREHMVKIQIYHGRGDHYGHHG
ncbi:MAG: Spy/CpxP family protein refolding chaperone [Gammaproteobacteria bacterium]|nr:Spy/CpxP family protein refolding chaperone [Gammaproteobacteria bacterium]